MRRLGYTKLWPKAATGVGSSRSSWLPRRLRNCSVCTPTSLERFLRTLKRQCSPAIRLRPASPPMKDAHTSSSKPEPSRGATRSEMGTRPKHDPDSRIHPSAWQPGCSTMTPPVRSNSHTPLLTETRSVTSHERTPRQHHALLVDEHGSVFGSPLLGEQVQLFRR